MATEELKIESINLNDITDVYVKKSLESINDGEIILIPTINFRGKQGYTYPEGTLDFSNYLTERTENIKFAFSDYYNENVLHHDWIRIVEIAIESALLPFLIGLLINFVSDKIKKANKKTNEVKVDVSLKIKKEEKILNVKYTGDASKLVDTMEVISKMVNDEAENTK